MLSRIHIHYFDEIGAVDDGIQTAAVYLQIIAHIAELFHYSRIAFCINIFGIYSGFIIEIIERGFIVAHIAFVEQEKTLDLAGIWIRINYL